MARRNLFRRILLWTLGTGIACKLLCGVCLFWVGPRVSWNMRYGNGIARHQATLNAARRATRIGDIPRTLPVEKWLVHESRVALGESTRHYAVMLKYCRAESGLEYAVIAWADKNLMVRRYLRVQRQDSLHQSDAPTGALTIPASIEAFAKRLPRRGS